MPGGGGVGVGVGLGVGVAVGVGVAGVGVGVAGCAQYLLPVATACPPKVDSPAQTIISLLVQTDV